MSKIWNSTLFYICTWSILIYAMIFFADITGPESSSNDSRYYRDLVMQANIKNWFDWPAPRWHGNYGRPWNEYVRDHFQGHIFVGALISKIGINPSYSLDLANCLFLLGSMAMLAYLLTQHGTDKKYQLSIPALLTLMPITLTYGLRSNHCPHLLFWTCVLLVSTHFIFRLQKNYIGYFLLALTCFYGLWVKGLMVAMFIPLIFVDWLFSSRKWKPLLLVGATACLTFLLSAFIYEKWYQESTGLSFLHQYWNEQIVHRSINNSGVTAKVNIMHNFLYYLGRVMVNTLPWCIPALFLYKKFKNKTFLHFLSLGVVLILPFCFQYRIAGRYIFQSYYLIGCAFISLLLILLQEKNKISLSKWAWPTIWTLEHTALLVIHHFK